MKNEKAPEYYCPITSKPLMDGDTGMGEMYWADCVGPRCMAWQPYFDDRGEQREEGKCNLIWPCINRNIQGEVCTT